MKTQMFHKNALKHKVFPFNDLYESLVEQAKRYGDKVRYTYIENKEEKTVTFNGMLDRVNWLSSAMNKFGLEGKNICVTGETHPDYVATYMSTVFSGGVIIPLDKDISNEQFANFNKMCDTSCIVYMSSQEEKIAEVIDSIPSLKMVVRLGEPKNDLVSSNPKFITFDDFINAGKENYESGVHNAENRVIDLDRCCAIIFTSGTTGSSKGVMLSERNLVNAANDSCRQIGVVDTDSLVSVLPIHHTYEFTCSHLALPNTGATTFINDSIKNTLRNFAKVKPTTLFLVPLYVETMHKKVWSEITRQGKADLIRKIMPVARRLPYATRRSLFKDIIDAFGGNLSVIVCGGAPLRQELIDDFDAFGIKILEGYGITECAPLISANMILWRKRHSCGMRVEHMQVKIDKAEDEKTGEILAKGPAVMLGYYKNQEATDAVFTEDGWFRTGDIGYMDDDGFIYITGRKKNIILLSNGKNVFPEELEEYLASNDKILECVVVGRTKENEDTVITALIYPDFAKYEGKTKEEILEEMNAFVTTINKKLPIYKHISEVEIRDTEFEKNTTKKILRYKVK